MDGPRRRWWQEWPLALALLIAAVGLVLCALQYVRKGPALIGVAALVAAALRLVLSDEDAGLLAVRRRSIDVAGLVAIGVATILVTLTIQPLS